MASVLMIFGYTHYSFALIHLSYQLMTCCWEEAPDKRPTFTKLRQDLEDWMQKQTPYLDVGQVDEDQPYYDAAAESPSSGSSLEAEEHT